MLNPPGEMPSCKLFEGQQATSKIPSKPCAILSFQLGVLYTSPTHTCVFSQSYLSVTPELGRPRGQSVRGARHDKRGSRAAVSSPGCHPLPRGRLPKSTHGGHIAFWFPLVAVVGKTNNVIKKSM